MELYYFNKNNEKALRFIKEIQWPKAYREQDVDLLQNILADEFKMIDSSGDCFTKDNEIDYVKSHKPAYHTYQFKIERLEIFENGTAIVAGTGIVKGSKGHTEYQSSDIFIKRKGQWKAVASHVSGLKKIA